MCSFKKLTHIFGSIFAVIDNIHHKCIAVYIYKKVSNGITLTLHDISSQYSAISVEKS